MLLQNNRLVLDKTSAFWYLFVVLYISLQQPLRGILLIFSLLAKIHVKDAHVVYFLQQSFANFPAIMMKFKAKINNKLENKNKALNFVNDVDNSTLK